MLFEVSMQQRQFKIFLLLLTYDDDCLCCCRRLSIERCFFWCFCLVGAFVYTLVHALRSVVCGCCNNMHNPATKKETKEKEEGREE